MRFGRGTGGPSFSQPCVRCHRTGEEQGRHGGAPRRPVKITAFPRIAERRSFVPFFQRHADHAPVPPQWARRWNGAEGGKLRSCCTNVHCEESLVPPVAHRFCRDKKCAAPFRNTTDGRLEMTSHACSVIEKGRKGRCLLALPVSSPGVERGDLRHPGICCIPFGMNRSGSDVGIMRVASYCPRSASVSRRRAKLHAAATSARCVRRWSWMVEALCARSLCFGLNAGPITQVLDLRISGQVRGEGTDEACQRGAIRGMWRAVAKARSRAPAIRVGTEPPCFDRYDRGSRRCPWPGNPLDRIGRHPRSRKRRTR
jgi:hypothetical protein